jgi:hypothetical protein
VTPGAVGAWLLVSLVLLVLSTRWFSNHVRGLVLLLTSNAMASVYVYFFLLFPGTLAHELSHLLVAKLLGVQTGRLHLGPKVQTDGVIQFGAVEYRRPDALRESLIGLAPLVTGSALVLLVAERCLGLDPQALLNLSELPTRLWQATQSPDAWLWLYLILAISNAMIPSAADRRAWRTLLIAGGILLAALLALLLFTDTAGQVPKLIPAWFTTGMAYLAFAFTLTLTLDLLIGGVVWLVEVALGGLLKRRIVYS